MSATAIEWSRTLHLLGVILWIGGLLGLALLLRTHASASASSLADLVKAERAIASVMELGAFLALLAGVYMLVRMTPSAIKQPWMHIKLTVVVLAVFGAHGYLRVALKKADRGETKGVPALMPVIVMAAAAGVIVLAVVRPLAK